MISMPGTEPPPSPREGAFLASLGVLPRVLSTALSEEWCLSTWAWEEAVDAQLRLFSGCLTLSECITSQSPVLSCSVCHVRHHQR